jgi:glycerol-3-phosphate acyltransferase PlsY
MALLVFIVDAGKAAAAVLLVAHLGPKTLPLDVPVVQILSGLAVMAGNIWPVWVGFAGGKGVSTSAGVLLALAPLATGCAALVWMSVVAMTRYVSLASICASLTLPLVLWLRSVLLQSHVPFTLLLFTLLVPVIVLVTHRSNIRRLFSGTENRIGSKIQKMNEP